MKRTLILIAAMGISTFLHAAKLWPVLAVQNGGRNFGTDAGTTTYPKGGLNTMPTKEVGNEENTVNPNAPATKPFMAPAFSPPPKFAPAPAFTPPASQGGTPNKPLNY